MGSTNFSDISWILTQALPCQDIAYYSKKIQLFKIAYKW